ncbi:MAG TPA: transglutaminase-like domain-containing protein, partial [Tahibacter sp.]|nr:transglutaminase-like domain-containing protein [Tahibacter sp.]
DCGEETAPDADALARYRAANTWVQSDHPALRSLSREARANGSIEARMHKLVRFVQSYMTGERRSLGYASALQAAESRSGDCTEFALLLAALARAQQIPTRVVGGLVYSSHFTDKGEVFSPHAWVQVWNGSRWISFDAGLGDFDSTHVVLAIGDGSAGDYAGLLRQVRGLRLVDAGFIAGNRESGMGNRSSAQR